MRHYKNRRQLYLFWKFRISPTATFAKDVLQFKEKNLNIKCLYFSKNMFKEQFLPNYTMCLVIMFQAISFVVRVALSYQRFLGI